MPIALLRTGTVARRSKEAATRDRNKRDNMMMFTGVISVPADQSVN
jgi:hypothetical protein